MWPFGGRRKTEEPSDEDIARQAGRLLCAYAGLAYTRNTARYLAEVARYNRWEELTPETRLRLITAAVAIGGEQFESLVSDILD